MSNGIKQSNIVRLNIGGKIYQTTRSTLLSKGTNFFTSLLSDSMPTTIDETGAYFIDRNGTLFAPILDYLRTGILSIPPTMTLETVLRESSFYCINAAEGLCHIEPGLYSSQSSALQGHSWMLHIQRDIQRFPDRVGITGVFGDQIIIERTCPILPGGIIDLNYTDKEDKNGENDLHLQISLSEDDPTGKSIDLRFPDTWKSSRRLTWRAPPSNDNDEFPIQFGEKWTMAQTPDASGKSTLTFENSSSLENSDHIGIMRIVTKDGMHSWYSVSMLCSSLLVVRSQYMAVGLIYISGKVVFFIEGKTQATFAVHALKKLPGTPAVVY